VTPGDGFDRQECQGRDDQPLQQRRDADAYASNGHCGHPIRIRPGLANVVPAFVPAGWLGAAIFGLGFGLAIWAIVTIRQAGSRVETNMPTTTIVTSGPYRFTRNPIYVAMFIGQVGLAVGFNSLWLFATLVLFYFVIRYGVVAREEAYLERKFSNTYLDYKSRVGRWL
jgi:protein-S-isoprenylcysteine O-methyltransferase Ste14